MFPPDVVELFEQCRKHVPDFQLRSTGMYFDATWTYEGKPFQLAIEMPSKSGKVLSNARCLVVLRYLLRRILDEAIPALMSMKRE